MDYELYHHGILGMRWGIRRFQNKDGSLTAEGIKRYRTDTKFKDKYDRYTEKQEQKKAEKAREAEVKRINKLKNASLDKLTEAELNERLSRIALEQRVRDLEGTSGNSGGKGQQNGQNAAANKAINTGKSIVQDVVSATGKVMVGAIAKTVGNAIVDKVFGKDDKSNKKEAAKETKEALSDTKDTIKDAVNAGKNAINNLKWNDTKVEKTNPRIWEEYSTSEKEYRNAPSLTYSPYGSTLTNASAEWSSSRAYGKSVTDAIMGKVGGISASSVSMYANSKESVGSYLSDVDYYQR